VRPMQAVCSPRCAAQKVKADKAQERAQIRTRKEAIKTRGEWIKECQALVNRYCRLRDIRAGKGCITCDAPYREGFGGLFDAGHWRSVGSAPQLRFFTSQIRLQCTKCNRFGAGRAVEFRRALVAERGEEWVQSVEAMNAPRHWDTDYLRRLKAVMTKRIKRLEKRS